MTDTLTAEQVNAAVVMLQSHWATQPFSDSVKDTWRRKLASLRQGEFTPALDAWFDGPRSRWRPEVGEFMDIVTSRRRRALTMSDVSRPHPDGPEPIPDRERNLAHLAELRERLNPKADA